MKQNCSCGFIIAEVRQGFPTGWLLCHPTNSGNRWDFPKGHVDPGEQHLDAALRELYEETGLLLAPSHKIIDLGQHPYQDKKDLHLFYLEMANIDTGIMHCSSMVENKNGPDFPEMDAFSVFEMHKISAHLSDRMNAWVNSHVPGELLIGFA